MSASHVADSRRPADVNVVLIGGLLHGCQEYLPRTRDGEGLSSLTAGSRLYESCLRWYLPSISGDVTATTLHRIGRDSVANILSRIDKVNAADCITNVKQELSSC